MGLLDVNPLVALAWDSHIHHAATRSWFALNSAAGWATCPVTESLTLARRHGVRVVTFDGAVRALGGPNVELLTTL